MFFSTNQILQNLPRIPHGIVISGEASESDEEIDTHQALPQSGRKHSWKLLNLKMCLCYNCWLFIFHDFSASDFSISDAWRRSPTELPDKEASKESPSVQYNTYVLSFYFRII